MVGLKKRVVLFGFEDVLVPGRVEKKIDLKNAYGILKECKLLSEKNKEFHFVLVTGYAEKKALEKIVEFKLGQYFEPKNMYFVNQKYIESKSKLDKELYLKKLEQDPSFKDEYFKQTIIAECEKRFGCEKKDMVLVGHDIWTEAYYTMLFSGIDFVLIRSAHSHLDKKLNEELKCVTYINRNWKDIKKVVFGKIIASKDLSCLNQYAQKRLSEGLFEGTKLGSLTKLSNSLQR